MNTEYCFLWIDHWSTCMTKAEWSGWMQAIFSVAAIAVGAAVVFAQLRYQRLTAHLDELRARQESALALAHALEEAAGRIRRALGLFDSGRTLDHDDFIELAVACDVVRALPDESAPTVRLRVTWRKAQQLLISAQTATTRIHEYFEEGIETDVVYDTLLAKDRLNRIATAAMEMRSYAESVLDQVIPFSEPGALETGELTPEDEQWLKGGLTKVRTS